MTRPPGYLLDLRGARVDAEVFEDGCRGTRPPASRPILAQAVRLFDAALALWRGPAFGEFAESFARPVAVRLEALRRAAARGPRGGATARGARRGGGRAAEDLLAEHPLPSVRLRSRCGR